MKSFLVQMLIFFYVVNAMTAVDQAPCVTRSSAAMLVT